MLKKFLKALLAVGILLALGKAGFVLFSKQKPLDFSGEKNFSINENGYLFTASAGASTVGEFLDSEDIRLSEHDIIFPDRQSKLLPGTTIQIARALPVRILVDNQEIDHYTFRKDVESVIHEAGITLSHLDKVDPGKNEGVEDGMEIEITRINIEQVIKQESIEFDTVEEEDDDLRWRKKKVKQKGEEGIKEVIYEVTYKNGEQVSKDKISSKIVKEPVDEVVRLGTKVEVGKSKIGIASWYAYTGTMACASRMFSKGTWLRVTSQENGKQVFVVVNDYGPQRGTGKMIDLDSVAFKKLAPLGKGVIQVKVEEILE